MENYKISIVTVCYNAESTIKETIESVINQTYENIEYIIKDGLSSDNTNTIIKQYASSSNIKHIVSKDLGIYDAMNEAIQECTGDWIIFMNADDQFFDNNVLRDIFANCEYDNYDAIYGNALMKDEVGTFLNKALPISYITIKKPFVHQSLFVKASIMKKYLYSLEFSISSDYDFALRIYNDGYKFLRLDNVVCVFSLAGVSGTKFIDTVKDTISVVKNHDLYIGRTKRFYIVKIIESYIKTAIQRVISGNMLNKMKKIYMLKIKRYKVFNNSIK